MQQVSRFARCHHSSVGYGGVLEKPEIKLNNIQDLYTVQQQPKIFSFNWQKAPYLLLYLQLAHKYLIVNRNTGRNHLHEANLDYNSDVHLTKTDIVEHL